MVGATIKPATSSFIKSSSFQTSRPPSHTITNRNGTNQPQASSIHNKQLAESLIAWLSVTIIRFSSEYRLGEV